MIQGIWSRMEELFDQHHRPSFPLWYRFQNITRLSAWFIRVYCHWGDGWLLFERSSRGSYRLMLAWFYFLQLTLCPDHEYTPTRILYTLRGYISYLISDHLSLHLQRYVIRWTLTMWCNASRHHILDAGIVYNVILDAIASTKHTP